MITDLIVTLLTAPVSWLLSALPTWSPPSWLDGHSGCTVQPSMGCYGFNFGQQLAPINKWVPIDTLLTLLPVVALLVAVVVTVRVLRMVVSALTGGGGGAA